jgi:hypothetical protein
MKYYQKIFSLALFLILFSNKSYCKDFIFTGSAGSTLATAGNAFTTNYTNWTEVGTASTRPIATDFTTSGNTFDLNGKMVSFHNMTLGDVDIITSVGGASAVIKSTGNNQLTISTNTPPDFKSSTSFLLTYDFSNGILNYTSNSAGSQTLISYTKAKRIKVSGNDKVAQRILFDNFENTTGVKITLSKGFEITSSTPAFTVGTTSKPIFELTGVFESDPAYPNIYFYEPTGGGITIPGKLILNDASLTGVIPPGTYTDLEILQNVSLYDDGTGLGSKVNTVTVNGDLNLTANKTFKMNTQILEIKGTVTNTNGVSGGKIIGDDWCSIICSGSATLYFDQSSTTTKNINDINVTSSGVFTLGNDLIVDSLIYLDGAYFSINGKTLTINGEIEYPNNNGFLEVVQVPISYVLTPPLSILTNPPLKLAEQLKI